MRGIDEVRTVDEYLAAMPDEVRQALEKLRATISKVAPDATEVISYKVPTFKHHGSLVGFGATKDGCSLYVMSPPLVASLKDELAPYDAKGATIHFTPEKPLPDALVRKVVKARMAENETRRNR